MAGEIIRSFIAVGLPGDLIRQLKDFQAGLKSPEGRTAKWVDPASMHLTLKFLGDVDVNGLAAVKDETAVAVGSSRRFYLFTGRTGFFPDPGRPRVFWLGLEGDVDALLTLHKNIDAAMSKLGFASEKRPFTAHLTLARLREESSTGDRLAFARMAQAKAFDPPCKIEVGSVALMRSRLTPQGAVYTRLAEFGLPDS
jgi:2'-5' RNA ligase